MATLHTPTVRVALSNPKSNPEWGLAPNTQPPSSPKYTHGVRRSLDGKRKGVRVDIWRRCILPRCFTWPRIWKAAAYLVMNFTEKWVRKTREMRGTLMSVCW